MILETVGLDSAISDADLGINSEGSVKEQTIFHRTPVGGARLAQVRGIPVIRISATLGKNFEKVYEPWIDAVVAIAAEGGWARPGAVVTEANIAETARDIIDHVLKGSDLQPVSRLITRSRQ